MKISLLLMIVALTQVSAAVYAQKINLNENSISIEKALSAVKAQSGFQIVYIQPVLENNPQITLHLKNVTVEEALKTILSNQPVEYSIIEKTIVIREKIKQETPSQKPNIQAAMTFINGWIVDEKGLPLPGVSVRIKGTTSGTVTTAAGQFSVGLTDKEKAVLVFSLIGYATQEIPAATVKDPLVIQMKLDISKLDEVQVIAYGTTTKRNQTGAISTIDEKVIGNYPTTNVLDALQGTVPGINISKATGNINGSYKVLVRGQNSVSATSGAGGTGSNPLYIIDGIPYQGGTYDLSNTTISKNGAGNDALNFINPLDIESISVLKDADATSIYGSRVEISLKLTT